MKRVYSVVWQFFDRLQENKRCVAVLCKLCDTEIKYFGNTTNLRAHLTRKHPLQWEFRQKSLDEDQKIIEQPSVLFLSYEDNEGATSSKRQKYGETNSSSSKVELSENETNDDDDEMTLNLVRQLHGESQASDEEWLEDDYDQYKTLKSTKMRKHLPKIKKEPMSPIHRVHGSSSAMTQHSKQSFDQNKDEYSIFGEYIANKIRKLKSQRTRANIQQIITTVLWQAEYGAYEDPESVKKILMQSHETEQPNDQTHEINTADCYGTENNGEEVNGTDINNHDGTEVNIENIIS